MSGMPTGIPLESERTVLGAMLLSGSMVDVAGVVDAADFIAAPHRAVFDALSELDRASQPIDMLSVASSLVSDSHLFDAVGGVTQFLAQLQTDVLTVENLGYHAKRVRSGAVRRRSAAAVRELHAKLVDANYSDEEVLADIERVLLDLTKQTASDGPQPIKALLHEWTRELEQRHERFKAGKPAVGISTGYPSLDTALTGLRDGDLIVVAGRPAMGKTGFGISLVDKVAANGVSSLVFSLEMSATALIDRLVSAHSRVDSLRIQDGNLATVDWKRITSATAELADTSIVLDDRGGLSIAQIRSAARQWRARVAKGKPALILVDYIGLVTTTERHSTREQVVAEISRSLKALAKELRCPVIALSQLNRGVESRENKRPTLADLRESGAVEQDADAVLFLYRDSYYHPDSADKDLVEIIIAKQRCGPTGKVSLKFVPDQVRFEELSPVREAEAASGRGWE
jgi:replicative DNA helicase